MNYSEGLVAAYMAAVRYSKSNHLEYCTPETVLLFICENELFKDAFRNCGGDIDTLKKDLIKHIAENIDTLSDSSREPEESNDSYN